MNKLREVIRRLILESDGITPYEVNMASREDGGKRFKGHMAKRVFADKADRNFLNSLTYITTLSADRVDSWLSQANSRDELSCIAIEDTPSEGVDLDLPWSMGGMFTNRIALIVEGWVTWLSNKNAATGHSGRILRDEHQGEIPESGINKAPGKMYSRGRFNPRELDGVIMDEDDLWNQGLMDFDGNPNQNNEALLDNWTITGVVIPVDDLSGDVQMDFEIQNEITLEAYEKIKERWPEAKLYTGVFD
tara:strand:+ start:1055 stop:1798 length:744 start_codon:yes stop_codon:yes gene_type:complete